MNFFTVSAVAATLRSASVVSFRIASFTRLFADQQDDDQADDHADHGGPPHQEDEALIALAVGDDFLLELAFRRHVDPRPCWCGDLLSTRRRRGKAAHAPAGKAAGAPSRPS